MTTQTAAALPRVPSAQEWQWQDAAACRGRSELFFHPPGEREPSRSRRDAAALEVCHACPVQGPCRDYVLTHEEPYGVWGGLTETDRAALEAAAG